LTENENLPMHVEGIENGTISYANEVIAIIAGMAASEVDGVARMGSAAVNMAERLGRSKAVTRGVKVEVGEEEASVDLTLMVEYGKPIQKVCIEVQEGVRKAIETMTGLHVLRVDVHVAGVSFEKENKELQKSIESVTVQPEEPAAAEAPVVEAEVEAPQEPVQEEEAQVETDDDEGEELEEGE